MGDPATAPLGKAAVLAQLRADLRAESDELFAAIGTLADSHWDRETPAAGWAVRDQVTHLAFFDDATILALRDPAAFLAQRDELLELGTHFPDVVAERHRHLSPAQCREWLHHSRTTLLAAYEEADPAARLPWYGPDMGVATSATGRLMETWAHGQDIRDTVGVMAMPTARLRHIADIGVRTFAFCFRLRGLEVPASPVRVELDGPDGARWTWGPRDAADRVTGTALDFCLVVTQRRNVADTGLVVAGPTAHAWIRIAQVFAGRPTDPRPATARQS